jgi:hypothetical protein
MAKQISVKRFERITLKECPKCKTDKLSIRYRSGVSKNKVPFFFGSIKCLNCKHLVEATNPTKLVKIFGEKHNDNNI